MNSPGKSRFMIDLAISSLLRRWKKNLGLLGVYTIIVFFLASVMFFTQAMKNEARTALEESPDVVVQKLTAGRHDHIPEAYIEQLRGLRGASHVRGRLWGYYYDPSVGANYTIAAAGNGGLTKGSARIGTGVARALRAGPGDLVPLQAHDGAYSSFEVAEVFSSSSSLVSADLIEITEEDFRELFKIPQGTYTDIILNVRNPREGAVISDKIRRLLPDSRPVLKSELLRTYEAAFDWRGGILLVIFAGAVLAFIIFAWDKATGLSMEERKEIGILKAVGWDTAEVIALKSWEGIVISLSAFLTGTIMAYVHVFMASSALLAPVLKGWAVIYPEFRMAPTIDFHQLAALLFLTVVPYLTAMIVPVWLASSSDPDSVMRL